MISGEVGLHKPQPEIYLLACERLGVEPAEAVFVDDLRENCAGAEAVGMTAVLHREPDETVGELERLLGARAQQPEPLSPTPTSIRPRRSVTTAVRPPSSRRQALPSTTRQ